MISIIVPIYNVENYLAECLDSLLKQTYTDWQAILVDDASTDHSLAIARQYAERDNRFRVKHLPTNGGLSVARNEGLKEANGEWVTFVDSDDWLQPEFLATLLSCSVDADIVQSGYKRMLNGKEIERKCPNRNNPYVFTSACMRLYRMQWFERTHIQFKDGLIYEDVLFSAQLWKRHPRIKVVEAYAYCYRVNPCSITSQTRDSSVIRNLLHQEGLGLFEFNALRLRLYAHFIKNRFKA